MNDLFLLEPEYHYRAAKTRRSLAPVRYRKWRRRTESDAARAAAEKNWIN